MRANPELIRNVRAQLRGERMIAVAAICLVLSLVVGFSGSYRFLGIDRARWGVEFLHQALWVQAMVLVLGGGFAALQAIQREKEMNTFDFQRVTRLSPWELTIGKLLGAPALMYFIALCLVPAAVVGAVVGGARPPFLLAGYVILILGAVTVHAFALLLSLLVERGVASLGVILILLALWTGPVLATGFVLNLGSLSPLIASDITTQVSWAVDPGLARNDVIFAPRLLTDVLFGWPVHHVYVLVVLYLVFTAWFLLAVARNIKRDPAVYQIYTPAQALGLAVWINLIFLGFFRWSRFAPFNAVNTFLGLNAALFFALGLVLLRNRDTIRRLRAQSARAGGWVAALWPAPYVFGGSLVTGLVPVAILQMIRPPDAEWDLGLVLFRVAVIAAWITRDLLFLQWMNLLRGRGRPIRRGMLYLAVFYACAGVLVTTLHSWTSGDPVGLATAGVFLPPMVLNLSPAAWAAGWALWLAGLGLQVAVVWLFVRLQHGKLAELAP
jgi:hypothetical protein